MISVSFKQVQGPDLRKPKLKKPSYESSNWTNEDMAEVLEAHVHADVVAGIANSRGTGLYARQICKKKLPKKNIMNI